MQSGGPVVSDDVRRRRFERLALPHLDAAFRLARWLAGNAEDAGDVVQDAYLRAFRYFDTLRGDDARVWLLAIVRTSFVSWAQRNRSARMTFTDEAMETEPLWTAPEPDPEQALLRRIDSATLEGLIAKLPAEYRTALLLREVEDLSYREIAAVTGVPEGTVMSRLARARVQLRRLWAEAGGDEV